MAVTLSHQSALDVIRTLRSEGVDMCEMDATTLAAPSAWVGRRLGAGNFEPNVWRWQRPTTDSPLHILALSNRTRSRGKLIVAHAAYRDMPPGSILLVDEHVRMACPNLVFLQMAEQLSLPAMVMLGLELCGHFSRSASDPLSGAVIDEVPAATDVESLRKYLASFKSVKGLAKAREALEYVCDHAVSAPEAVLATMYGLPREEGGYGLGPVVLNERVQVRGEEDRVRGKARYPDLMFDFAPVGLNYDGFKHFDVSALMASAERFACADVKERGEAREALRRDLLAVRAKVLDDNLRDRQLAARGKIVFSVTKEDLSDGSHLDELTRQVLDCAHQVFDVDVDEHLCMLEDTAFARDRWDLLGDLLPRGRFGASSYGKL